jgi:hypothetical protein
MYIASDLVPGLLRFNTSPTPRKHVREQSCSQRGLSDKDNQPTNQPTTLLTLGLRKDCREHGLVEFKSDDGTKRSPH